MGKFLTRRALATGSAAALVVGVALSAAPAAPAAARPNATKLASFTVSVALQTVKSSTHKTLRVFIGGSNSSDGGGNASFSVSAKGTSESHFWSFPLNGSSVAYNPGTGKGSIKTGKQAKPYGTLDLTLKANGKKQVTNCHGLSSVVQPVSVKGSWSFNTRSKGKHKWGKAGGHGKLHGKSSVSYTTGSSTQSCGGTGFPCFAGTSWSAQHPVGTRSRTSISGSVSKHSSVTGSRFVALAKPKGASRSDTVFTSDRHVKFSVKNGKATVKVGPDHGISGSATLAASQAGQPSSPFACGKGSKVEKTTRWQTPYKNGKAPLTVHEQIEGAIKVPDQSASSFNASISKTTVGNA
jgi:hypothetical protein